jgi:hypothetical protein
MTDDKLPNPDGAARAARRKAADKGGSSGAEIAEGTVKGLMTKDAECQGQDGYDGGTGLFGRVTRGGGECPEGL